MIVSRDICFCSEYFLRTINTMTISKITMTPDDMNIMISVGDVVSLSMDDCIKKTEVVVKSLMEPSALLFGDVDGCLNGCVAGLSLEDGGTGDFDGF